MADKGIVEQSAVSRVRWRAPVVELLGACVAVGVLVSKHSLHDVLLGLVLLGALVPVTLSDLERRIIPNKITLPAALLAVAIGLATKPGGVPEQLIAAVAAGGFLLVFALIHPAGMGMGDVKLAAVLGLYLGRYVGAAMAVAVIGAALAGIAVIGREGISKGRKTGLPFGPFLALGAVVALLAGGPLVHWYVHTMI